MFWRVNPLPCRFLKINVFHLVFSSLKLTSIPILGGKTGPMLKSSDLERFRYLDIVSMYISPVTLFNLSNLRISQRSQPDLPSGSRRSPLHRGRRGTVGGQQQGRRQQHPERPQRLEGACRGTLTATAVFFGGFIRIYLCTYIYIYW